MNRDAVNVDPQELAKFESLAARWWDPSGELHTLHDINPVRLQYIEKHAGLAGRQVIDIGCGGGILAEAMAKRGASVTGLDASDAALKVAELHQLKSAVQITYVCATPEQFAEDHPSHYDVVTCMELLEHVPDPARVIEACARLTKPGGQLFFSTINRTAVAYLFAVIGAEYLLNILPKGTHNYRRFICPSELAGWARQAGLTLSAITGLSYNPFTRRCVLTDRVDVNYLIYAELLNGTPGQR
jgi:2-polyprenyl-6-hydroxyphenyl methylase/3-demethylubiquinone-9 3-methyltransferase